MSLLSIITDMKSNTLLHLGPRRLSGFCGINRSQCIISGAIQRLSHNRSVEWVYTVNNHDIEYSLPESHDRHEAKIH